VIQEALLALAERIQKLEDQLANNSADSGKPREEKQEKERRVSGAVPNQKSRQILDNLLTSK